MPRVAEKSRQEILAQPSSAYPRIADTEDTLGRFLGADGSLTPERQALHDAILADTLSGLRPVRNPKFTIMGGGPSSGKSGVRKLLDLDVED